MDGRTPDARDRAPQLTVLAIMDKPATDPKRASAASDRLEGLVTRIEAQLEALRVAMLDNKSDDIEVEAAKLHKSLAQSMEAFVQAAREGGVPAAMRARLAAASAVVATQREALARATAALDRAIDVLIHSDGHTAQGQGHVYSEAGVPVRPSKGSTEA